MKFKISRLFLLLNCLSLLGSSISCAPLHIKEHQAADVPGRCGLGSNSKYRQHADIQTAEFSIRKSKHGNRLTFVAMFWGVLGKTIMISSQPVEIRFVDGKQLSVSGKLISRQLKNDPSDSPNEKAIAWDKPHTFKVDKGYLENFVLFDSDFEFHPMDLEIELPQIIIEGKILPPITVKFKYTDRWTLQPLNGC